MMFNIHTFEYSELLKINLNRLRTKVFSDSLSLNWDTNFKHLKQLLG